MASLLCAVPGAPEVPEGASRLGNCERGDRALERQGAAQAELGRRHGKRVDVESGREVTRNGLSSEPVHRIHPVSIADGFVFVTLVDGKPLPSDTYNAPPGWRAPVPPPLPFSPSQASTQAAVPPPLPPLCGWAPIPSPPPPPCALDFIAEKTTPVQSSLLTSPGVRARMNAATGAVQKRLTEPRKLDDEFAGEAWVAAAAARSGAAGLF